MRETPISTTTTLLYSQVWRYVTTCPCQGNCIATPGRVIVESFPAEQTKDFPAVKHMVIK